MEDGDNQPWQKAYGAFHFRHLVLDPSSKGNLLSLSHKTLLELERFLVIRGTLLSLDSPENHSFFTGRIFGQQFNPLPAVAYNSPPVPIKTLCRTL